MMSERILKRVPKFNQKGATAVEFAVIAAILFVILFGILEFGLIFMQEHYIANAAREGMRIGVRANNFNCYEATSECSTVPAGQRVFRRQSVRESLRGTTTSDGYLSRIYGRDNPNVIVTVDRDPNNANAANTEKTLRVTVTAPNIYPPILSSLIALFPGTGFTLPTTITFTAEGEYEDPTEP